MKKIMKKRNGEYRLVYAWAAKYRTPEPGAVMLRIKIEHPKPKSKD